LPPVPEELFEHRCNVSWVQNIKHAYGQTGGDETDLLLENLGGSMRDEVVGIAK
jgi:hypothetical protein